MTVYVTDTCKDCSATQINLNALTYQASMSTKTGEIGVSWRQVRLFRGVYPHTFLVASKLTHVKATSDNAHSCKC